MYWFGRGSVIIHLDVSAGLLQLVDQTLDSVVERHQRTDLFTQLVLEKETQKGKKSLISLFYDDIICWFNTISYIYI